MTLLRRVSRAGVWGSATGIAEGTGQIAAVSHGDLAEHGVLNEAAAKLANLCGRAATSVAHSMLQQIAHVAEKGVDLIQSLRVTCCAGLAGELRGRHALQRIMKQLQAGSIQLKDLHGHLDQHAVVQPHADVRSDVLGKGINPSQVLDAGAETQRTIGQYQARS